MTLHKPHALVSYIRGMCSDQEPYETIDAKLATLLEVVRDLEDEVDQENYAAFQVVTLEREVDELKETLRYAYTCLREVRHDYDVPIDGVIEKVWKVLRP